MSNYKNGHILAIFLVAGNCTILLYPWKVLSEAWLWSCFSHPPLSLNYRSPAPFCKSHSSSTRIWKLLLFPPPNMLPKAAAVSHSLQRAPNDPVIPFKRNIVKKKYTIHRICLYYSKYDLIHLFHLVSN